MHRPKKNKVRYLKYIAIGLKSINFFSEFELDFAITMHARVMPENVYTN